MIIDMRFIVLMKRAVLLTMLLFMAMTTLTRATNGDGREEERANKKEKVA